MTTPSPYTGLIGKRVKIIDPKHPHCGRTGTLKPDPSVSLAAGVTLDGEVGREAGIGSRDQVRLVD